MRIESSKPLRLPGAIENRQSKIVNRKGFTLIELLLVIGIISILASLTISVISQVFYSVKRSASERTIQRVYERITKRYGELTRQAKDAEPGFDAMLLAGGTVDRDRRRAKVIQLKLLQKWTFPMNYKEVWANVTIDSATGAARGHPTAVALWKLLFQRIDPARRDATPNSPTYGLCAANDPYTENAACLALIYEHLGSVDELTTSELADTDGDGIRELLDAFGTPLRFYRWPTDHVDDATPIAGAPQVVADQLFNLPSGLVNSTKLEQAFEKANQDADDRDNLLYDQSWFMRQITTPFGGQFFAVDVFEGRASSTNSAEHLWLKRMSFHRVSRQRQDQMMSPQARLPRAVYAPLVIVSANVDRQFGIFRADPPDPSQAPYATTWPMATINNQYLDYWLSPNPMMIYNGTIPAPGPISHLLDGTYVPADYPLQRQREFDNVYSFRARLNVEGQ